MPSSEQRPSALCFDDPVDAVGRNNTPNPSLDDIVARRLRRRDALRGLALLATAAGTGALAGIRPRPAVAASGETTLSFTETSSAVSPTHHVAPGYTARILMRWGDPVLPGAPAFDPANVTADAQAKQFGYNNDFIGYLPLPAGSANAEHGLLWVNHEYTNPDFMWSGLTKDTIGEKMTADRTKAEMAAHGGSVMEVRKENGTWSVVPDSRYARRVTATTPMRIGGPAAGHDRLKTAADPTGTSVLGMMNNCSGGKTPWGTILTGEENIHMYFSGETSGPEAANHRRFGVGGKGTVYPWWARHDARFDVAKEPNEANRFGWLVEIDPYDPMSMPVKRTALGRFKHEAGTVVVNNDGRVVVYCGDDEKFEYVYRFVSDGRFDATNRGANRELLDHGTLSVARFDADGTVRWLKLRHGEGPLNAANGFASQADVQIEARRAADLMGATKMDRPEDIEANPVTGVVYVVLTNNSDRTPEQVDAVNPRAKNYYGQIVALQPPGGRGKDADHAADTFRWELPLLAGDPNKPEHGAKYPQGISNGGWFSCPDNIAFDPQGRLWIATDQGTDWPRTGIADGIWACETEGASAYVTKCFFAVPIGAEMCGPEFTPDGKTFFVSVQHPAVDGVKGSNYDTPATRWPDFKDGVPPRPSVVVITKDDGGEIGS
ncbi:PhoX family phosphatase [Reyranella sp. CPCC 100927]|uniref:PhoX family protein n=1 Tax=Reyranella sp. CPCC 100927 TaxID=2599616 RepID=UPI0011B82C36|nr:PhoX family phosphatase [Reyranella sp. CPCC 100927]TWS95696.1 PhoX family phosphatase [Reyranella sp. CPCC 100927]